MAQRLYYYDASLATFEAEVTDIREVSRANGQSLWQIALDRSAFYPTSGGQPHDTGVLEATARSGAKLEVPIVEVLEDEAGEVWHLTHKPLLAGTRVEGRIDWARRLDHMQQHSGQHLLSAAFQREFAAPTVSFHLGEESSTIDLAVEGLGNDQMVRVERLANEVIAENRSVSLRTVQRDGAEALLASGILRKLPERQGSIRMVEIADFDLNACGGTHVSATGEIGCLLIRRIDKVSNGLRVEFVCGLRAVDAARRDFPTLSTAAALLSSAPRQLPEAIARLQAENKAAAKENQSLLEEIARHMAAELLAGAPQDNGLRFIREALENRDLTFLKLLARNLTKASAEAVVLLASTQVEPAAVLLARGSQSDVHCGNLLRERLAALCVRGGGSADMAQGAIPRDHLDELLAQVENAIRMSNPHVQG